MEKLGLEKHWKFLLNCRIFLQLFSYFLSISHIFCTFPKVHFWQFLTIPHFSPFSPIVPHSPLIFPHFFFSFSPVFHGTAAS